MARDQRLRGSAMRGPRVRGGSAAGAAFIGGSGVTGAALLGGGGVADAASVGKGRAPDRSRFGDFFVTVPCSSIIDRWKRRTVSVQTSMPAVARSSRIIPNDAPFSRSSAMPSRSGSSAANRFGGTPAKLRTASAKRCVGASAADALLMTHLLRNRCAVLSKRMFGVGRPMYQGPRFLPWAKMVHTASFRCAGVLA